MKKTLIIIAAIIIISNLPLFDFFFQENFTYSNVDGSFYYNEEGGKGKSFEGCQRKYAYFLQTHPDIKNKTLFRTFTIKPWRFWEWYQMIFHHKRFSLPFLKESS
jgi:hypothetical protein